MQNVQDNPNDVHSIARTPLQSAFGVNRYDVTRFQGNQIIKNSLKIHFLQNVQDNPNDVHSIARTPLQSAFGVNRYDVTRFQGQENANFTNRLCRNFYRQK